jgi:hypothetical protein
MLGFIKVDTYNTFKGAKWEMFNDRVLDRAHMKGLVINFQRNLNSMAEESTMDMVVKEKWVENLKKLDSTPFTKELNIIKNKSFVPILKFAKEGLRKIKDRNL